MALHDAIERGSDEALLLDSNKNISEGSGENLFIVKNEQLITPTPDNCLNGITRQSIIKIAQDEKIDVIEKKLKYEDLVDADEAFFTGTAVEVTPISKVDETTIGDSMIGPITKKLQKIFTDTVTNKNKKYAHWLDPIN